MKETIIASVLIVLLVAIANPFHVWMPTAVQMLIVVCLFAAFSAFAIFIVREHVRDEREGTHRMFAGRVAFLAGAAVLTVAIIVQELQNMLDVWLIAALVVMVLAKMGTAIYSEWNN
jgi:hypothetical protein